MTLFCLQHTLSVTTLSSWCLHCNLCSPNHMPITERDISTKHMLERLSLLALRKLHNFLSLPPPLQNVMDKRIVYVWYERCCQGDVCIQRRRVIRSMDKGSELQILKQIIDIGLALASELTAQCIFIPSATTQNCPIEVCLSPKLLLLLEILFRRILLVSQTLSCLIVCEA